jgi:hypothetical protein
MTISRLDERLAISAKIDAAKAAADAAYEHPDVVAARAKLEQARSAFQAADEAVDEIFEKHSQAEVEAVSDLMAQTPDLLTIGDGDDPLILRCAVTGLPIFAGDDVYASGNEEDGDLVMVLADAVTIHPELLVQPPQPATVEG